MCSVIIFNVYSIFCEFGNENGKSRHTNPVAVEKHILVALAKISAV